MLCVVVAVLQLRLLAGFIIGSKCDAINALLRVAFDKILDGNDRCFDVQTRVNEGIIILSTAAVINFLETVFVLRLCHEVVPCPGSFLSSSAHDAA